MGTNVPRPDRLVPPPIDPRAFDNYIIPLKPPPTKPSSPERIVDTDSATRKTFPMAAGLLDYFPDALAYVAWVSFQGNEKHNPGLPLHHARGKSTDHADCIIRHVLNRGRFDGDVRESGAAAWRSLALLQEELEQALGLPLPRGARPANDTSNPRK